MAEIIETTTQHMPSNAKVNSALALGIIGTALGAIGSGFGMGACGRRAHDWDGWNRFGGFYGGCNGFVGNGGFAYNNGYDLNRGCVNHEELYIERKIAADEAIAQKEFYEGKLSNLRQLTDAFFDSYKRDVDNSFNLYKYSRDSKDELMAKISEVDKKVDIMAAIRPYQDALIDNKINKNALIADFNLARRTCKMIEGQLVLPSTPEITGYGSYHSCN